MLYLWTRLRLALWAVRKSPPPKYLGYLRSQNLAPEWLYNPRDDRFSADIKFAALHDFLDRVVDIPWTAAAGRGRGGSLK